jgi:hypothetical protein
MKSPIFGGNPIDTCSFVEGINNPFSAKASSSLSHNLLFIRFRVGSKKKVSNEFLIEH